MMQVLALVPGLGLRQVLVGVVLVMGLGLGLGLGLAGVVLVMAPLIRPPMSCP